MTSIVVKEYIEIQVLRFEEYIALAFYSAMSDKSRLVDT